MYCCVHISRLGCGENERFVGSRKVDFLVLRLLMRRVQSTKQYLQVFSQILVGIVLEGLRCFWLYKNRERIGLLELDWVLNCTKAFTYTQPSLFTVKLPT